MAYFSHFPRTQFLQQDIVNLVVGIKINSLVTEDAFAFHRYVVEPGEKPDHVAYNYYGETSYLWLVMLSNNMLDPYFEWPLDTRDFEAFLRKKYGSVETAQATTIHCEHKTKDITLSADSLTVSNGVSACDYTSLDAYSYWDQINDNRRHIKLINVNYLSEIKEVIGKLS